MTNETGKRGGRREGAGRPFGTKKEVTRKTRSLRAFDDEWELIKKFEKILKRNRSAAEKMLSEHENAK